MDLSSTKSISVLIVEYIISRTLVELLCLPGLCSTVKITFIINQLINLHIQCNSCYMMSCVMFMGQYDMLVVLIVLVYLETKHAIDQLVGRRLNMFFELHTCGTCSLFFLKLASLGENRPVLHKW